MVINFCLSQCFICIYLILYLYCKDKRNVRDSTCLSPMRLTYPVRVPTVSDGEHTHHWELYTCVYKYVFGIVLVWSHFLHFKARSKLFCEIVTSKSESEDSWKVSNEFVGSWIGSQLHCSPFEQLHLVISNLNVKGKIAHGPPPTGVKVNSYASCHYHVQDMSPNIDIKMVLHSENVFLKGLKPLTFRSVLSN